MKRSMLAALLLVIVGSTAAQASETPAATGTAADGELAPGREVIEQFYRGELTEVYAKFSEEFKQEMTRDQLTILRKSVSDRLGLETELLGEEVRAQDDYSMYVRKARFEKREGIFEVVVSIRSDEQLGALFIKQISE